MSQDLSIIILAAGKGTRMQSDLPKVVHRTIDGPMISVITRTALQLAPKAIYIVTGHKKEVVEAVIDADFKDQKNIFLVEQTQQLGTGHAVKAVIDSTAFSSDSSNQTLILYGDTPLVSTTLLKRFCEAQEKSNAALSLISVNATTETAYGRIIRAPKTNSAELGELLKITEAKDCTPEEFAIREVNSGIYLVRTQILKTAVTKIKNENRQSEFYLTDLVEIIRSSKKGTDNTVTAWLADSLDQIQGVNDLADLLVVNKIMKQQKIAELLKSGVTFLDDTSVVVSPSVSVGKGSHIGPNVQILGNSIIGENVTIEGTAVIIDSSIGNNCALKLGVRIEKSTLHDHVSVGPFAHLRPDTELKAEVKIGNFVEVKKSTLESGVKVNHLSYIGDATIGSNSNIGAGTITCNYDGFNKSKTTIGENVFIGSNSSLVAPVTINANATVGAGSVITKDVVSGALALTRADQREIPGWSEKKRARGKR